MSICYSIKRYLVMLIWSSTLQTFFQGICYAQWHTSKQYHLLICGYKIGDFKTFKTVIVVCRYIKKKNHITKNKSLNEKTQISPISNNCRHVPMWIVEYFYDVIRRTRHVNELWCPRFVRRKTMICFNRFLLP